MQKLIVLSLLVSSFAWAADYSKCSNFLNPPWPSFEDSSSINPGVGLGGGIGGFGALGYLPFSLDEKGKIKPHDDVVSFSEDSNGNQTIVFELPSYVPDNNPNKQVNPFKQKLRQAQINIQRNDAGEITQIAFDQNLTQIEIDALMKNARTFYEQNTPEEVRKKNDEWARQNGNENGYQPPFFAEKSKIATFEIKNGQCVPMGIRSEAHIEPKKDGATFKSSQLNTPLCKELKDFLSENPEAAACLKSDLNNKISNIFKKYAPEPQFGFGFNGPYGAGGGGFPTGGFGMGGYGMPMWGMSLENYLTANKNPDWIPEGQRDAYFARVGSSPVITGNMLYQQCIDTGLSPILDDESIWIEAPITQSNSEEGSEEESAAEN